MSTQYQLRKNRSRGIDAGLQGRFPRAGRARKQAARPDGPEDLALREREEMYRCMIESSPDAIALVAEDGTLLAANSSMVERFFSKRFAGCGSSLLDAMQAEYAARHLAKGRETLGAKETLFAEEEIEGKHLHVHYVPVSLISGKKCFQFIAKDVTSQKQKEIKLSYMSFCDSLTGLYNRNFFEEQIKRVQKDPRYRPVGIIICDLDGLKRVNDAMGHGSGDRMLVATAELLRKNVRSGDIVARIGGDEFAVFVTETDRDALEELVLRLRGSVAAYNNAAAERPISLSIGYASSGRQRPDMQALFREADSRMYAEKMRRTAKAPLLFRRIGRRVSRTRDRLAAAASGHWLLSHFALLGCRRNSGSVDERLRDGGKENLSAD